MPRIVLLLPTATYRAPDFIEAATALDVEVVVASERRQALAGSMKGRALVVPFDDPKLAARRIVDFAREHPVKAVVPVDEAGVVPAALASAELGLRHNPPDAVATTRDKAELRRRLEKAEVPQPRFVVVRAGDDVASAARHVGLPCVVKAVSLSASRGVIRADTVEQAVTAEQTVRRVLRDADVGSEAPPDPDGPLLVESYVPGAEIAVEGLLVDGELQVLALFDKPDSMEGPYFAETILVTPSRHSDDAQGRIAEVASQAARAIGLVEGPIHAEVRVDGDRVWFLELAARSIGGLCSRTLRFGTGMSLEEVILRHAVGLPIPSFQREDGSAGVLMVPTQRAGVLREVRGVDDVEAVDGVDSVDFTVRPGTEVRALPESSRYLGFVFARGPDPATVEHALRTAWKRLDIVVDA